MREVKVAVIGVGVMGDLFTRILAEYPLSQLVAVADVNATRAQAVGSRWQVPAYASYEELLQRHGDLDAVFIATSDQFHLGPCVAAARLGKHIFLEKPLATTRVEGEQIIEAARRAGVVLQVAHCLRFDTRYAAAKQAIEQGQIGDIVHLLARREAKRAVGRRIEGRTNLAFFLGVHDIDLMHWYTGSRVKAVYTLGRRLEMADLGVDDSVLALLEFESGVIASLENSWILPNTVGGIPTQQFEIVGTRGMLNVDANVGGLSVYGADVATYPDAIFMPTPQGRQWGLYNAEIYHFLDLITKGGAPVVSGEEALQAAIVAEAITWSLAKGERIELK